VINVKVTALDFNNCVQNGSVADKIIT